MVRAAKIRPSVRDRKVGQLLLLPKPFAEGNGWQDYLAAHTMDTSRFRRVRFYLTRRAMDEELPVIRRAAEREFRLLQGMHHPGIPRAVDLVDHAWGPAVVFDHEQEWERLDQWLTRRGAGLTLAQRLTLVQDLAELSTTRIRGGWPTGRSTLGRSSSGIRTSRVLALVERDVAIT